MMAMSPLNAVKLEQTSDCSKETQCSCQKKSRLVKRICSWKQIYKSSLLFFFSFYTSRQHK